MRLMYCRAQTDDTTKHPTLGLVLSSQVFIGGCFLYFLPAGRLRKAQDGGRLPRNLPARRYVMIVNMRCIGLLLCLALLLQAQLQMNLQQLADFIRSELALRQHTDKQIAASVKKLQLTERLTDKTILDLQAQGAGPKRLRRCRLCATKPRA